MGGVVGNLSLFELSNIEFGIEVNLISEDFNFFPRALIFTTILYN